MTAAEFAAALKRHGFRVVRQRSKTRAVDVPALGGTRRVCARKLDAVWLTDFE